MAFKSVTLDLLLPVETLFKQVINVKQTVFFSDVSSFCFTFLVPIAWHICHQPDN